MKLVARVALISLLAGACTEATTELLADRLVQAPGDASVVDAAAPPVDASAVALCRNRACECNNGEDEDGDGLVDGQDPECTGPFDDDESSFATGVPGRGDNLCQDCFWDNNAGTGDDGCMYHVDCLFGDTPTGAGAGSCASCEVSERCESSCRDRTPSGCDCFGCCEVTTENGDVVNVVLSDGCSIELLGDRRMCPLCIPHPTCRNPCGRCELCPGRELADLPADCTDGNVCDEGQQVCSPDAPCPADFYCQLGCCQPIIVQ